MSYQGAGASTALKAIVTDSYIARRLPNAGPGSVTRQSIANTLLREKVARAGRIRLQLTTQVGHEHAKIMRLFDLMRAPHFLEQVAMRQYFSGVANQSRHQL